MCPQCFRAHLHPVVSIKLKQRQLWPCKIFLWLCLYYQLKLYTNGRGQQCLEFLTSVLPVECTRMQQLPTMLGPAVHRGKDTTHKTLKTMCNLRAWLQQLMLKEVCKRIQNCCATLRRSQSKRNLGSCWLKILLANKFASVWTRSQGWRSGESTRLPPMWPRFKSRRRCHNVSWVSSERFFSGYSRFSPLLKNQHLQIPIPQESGRRRTALWMCYLQIHYLFILF